MLTWGSFQFVLENFYIVEFIIFPLIFKAVNIKYITMFLSLSVFHGLLLTAKWMKFYWEALILVLWFEWISKIGKEAKFSLIQGQYRTYQTEQEKSQ